jgi:hypothetical protein
MLDGDDLDSIGVDDDSNNNNDNNNNINHDNNDYNNNNNSNKIVVADDVYDDIEYECNDDVNTDVVSDFLVTELAICDAATLDDRIFFVSAKEELSQRVMSGSSLIASQQGAALRRQFVITTHQCHFIILRGFFFCLRANIALVQSYL